MRVLQSTRFANLTAKQQRRHAIMPQPVELALAGLLPTISFLPPDLISLANSLLSQSRVKAAALKPEEEIGRTYACAHIACKRLEKKLDLDLGRPAPPVKPKVYDRLYKYLDSVVGTPRRGKSNEDVSSPKKNGVGRTEVGTPSKAKDDVGEKSTPKRATPSRAEESVARTPRTGEKRTRDDTEQQDNAKEVPGFVMPLVRSICKSCQTPAAVPHVLVGATAVVREIASRSAKRSRNEASGSKRRRRATQQSAKSSQSEVGEEETPVGIATEKWPALLVALHCLTAARMKGTQIEDERMQALRTRGVGAVQSFCSDQRRTLPEELSAGIESINRDIDFYTLEAEDYGWLEMEWYHNIPSNPEPESEPVIEESEQDEEQGPVTPRKRPYKTPLRRKEKHGGKAAIGSEDDVGAAGLLPGLGTMFQPAVDWLSDERRREYAVWKKGIIKEISEIEAQA